MHRTRNAAFFVLTGRPVQLDLVLIGHLGCRPLHPVLCRPPTIDQAANSGYSWLRIVCTRCKAVRDVDLAALLPAATTFVHDLAGRLRCRKCAKEGRRPSAMLQQLAQRARQAPPED